MALWDELHAAVFDAGRVERHPEVHLPVYEVGVVVGLVLMPGRLGADASRFVNHVLTAVVGFRPEELLRDVQHVVAEPRPLQLRREALGIQDLRKRGLRSVLIEPREVQVRALLAAGLPGKKPVVDRAELFEFLVAGQPLERQIALAVEEFDLVRREVQGGFGGHGGLLWRSRLSIPRAA
ncbi:MAG: hypothetical protein M5U26_09815 [Planctomycetota bacterium]|nr:hypothetical protein [Planctomycetota bacterium]